MMTKKLLEAVQKQINAEIYSSYLYLSMSSWAESEGWKGVANWMRVQAQEEMAHAMKLHDQLLERGERSVMFAVDMPPSEWPSLLAMAQDVCAHEEKVTASINNLATISMHDNDHAFYQFIQMFVKEQVEEEANAGELVVRFRRAGDNAAMLDMIDQSLAARVFTNPFPASAT